MSDTREVNIELVNRTLWTQNIESIAKLQADASAAYQQMCNALASGKATPQQVMKFAAEAENGKNAITARMLKLRRWFNKSLTVVELSGTENLLNFYRANESLFPDLPVDSDALSQHYSVLKGTQE